MKQQNPELIKEIIINTVKSMTDKQLNIFINNMHIDFKIWYRVKIDGKEMDWWACEGEIENIINRYSNVELIPISFAESWTN